MSHQVSVISRMTLSGYCRDRDLTGAAYKVINAAVTTRDLILHDSYYFSFYTVDSEILDPIAFSKNVADWSLDEWSRKIEGSESRKAWRC